MSSILDSVRAHSKVNSTDAGAEDATDEKPSVLLRKSWTLGDSNALVDGRPQESKLVGISWIAVPTLMALAIIYLMMPH